MIQSCGVCEETYSEELFETHHKVPQSLNGSDDPENLINVCSICHTAVHTVSRFLKKSSQKVAEFLYDTYGDKPKVHKLIIQLAKTILYEEEALVDKDFINVFLKVPKATHRLLSDLSKGSKINMQDYILNLIEKEGHRSLERGQFTLRRKK